MPLTRSKKIGVFDSGFGGLTILKGILKKLPQYDYIYLGDNARVPYGSRSPETTYQFTKQAVEYLMKRRCILVILACNTASALALRKLQKEWLPRHFPKNRILGVIRPTAETAVDLSGLKFRAYPRLPRRSRLGGVLRGLNPQLSASICKIGVLATESTVKSGAFKKEICKLNPNIKIFEQAAPLLVPIIETGEQNWLGTDLIIKKYLNPLLLRGIDVLILGCTHYPIIKKNIRRVLHKEKKGDIKIICEDEIIPDKLADYLNRHPEIEKRLSKKHKLQYLTTDLNPRTRFLGKLFLGKKIKARLIKLEN